ncbi:unnamed protein product [Lymnaea stagnalis]|uniref:RNA helicase n=1 Tax=Lymnaea stagnalis TaxID=6523 RepID=A0AAV2I373_LYMST
MYCVKHIFVNLCRNRTALRLIETNTRPFSRILSCGFASNKYDDGPDGFYSQNDHFEEDDRGGYQNKKNYFPKENNSNLSHFKENNTDFRPRRTPYGTSSHRGNFGDRFNDEFEGSYARRSRNELGLNIKQKTWNTASLPTIEKNFYVEHDSVAQRSEEEVDAFYKQHNITVKRGERPKPISNFLEANFPEEINQQLKINGWNKPTPIQSIGWPLALSGKNMVGIAQTGSGKTLGFMLPALVHIKHQRQVTKGEGPVVLVLAPTRELAQQIKSVGSAYGRLLGINTCCVFGGQSKLVQTRHLSEGPDIVVATPGRLLDFIEMGVVNLDRTTYVVLDEADRMLDMGFEPQIRKVLGQVRPDRQMLMWSATWPIEIQQLAHDFLGDFVQTNIGSAELMANPNIKQTVRVCDFHEKFNILVEELQKNSDSNEKQKTLIFTQTKTEADNITHKLRKLQFRALSIHGDKSQLVRDKTLSSFREGGTHILVATDVASRGLDVNDITLVVNYDYPNTADDYIHRIGRTARASKTGNALTLITEEDAGKVMDLIAVLKAADQEVPQELSDIVNATSRNKPRGSSKYSRKPFNYNSGRRNSW